MTTNEKGALPGPNSDPVENGGSPEYDSANSVTSRHSVSRVTSLMPEHERQLRASGIAAEVIAERGYFSLRRDNTGDTERRLRNLGISSKVAKERVRQDGFVIPMYGTSGERVAVQYRPDKPRKDAKGRPIKYETPSGHRSRLDIHPRNRDRVLDLSVPLWVTEGVKKADALTSHGALVVAMTGVFNWRSSMATLPDWEDIPIRGREVVICFDSDATTNMNVARAMGRLGRWLGKVKGAKRVTYVITPGDPADKRGADDYLADGGTLTELLDAGGPTPPNTTTADGTFSDAYMADTVADEVMDGRFRWSAGTDWVEWDGRVWARCDEAAVIEAVRLYAVDQFQEIVGGLRSTSGQASNTDAIDGWRSLLGKGRISSVVALAKGIVMFDAADMDADPDLLNARNGVVDLRTGELLPHDPDRLMSRLAGAEYDATAKHDALETMLGALPAEVAEWFQVRMGQAATGHMTPDDVMPLLHGGGENGKTTLMDTAGSALGTYKTLVPDGVLIGQASPFDLITLQGVRFALIEETPEAGRLDSVRLKKSLGSPEMRGAFKYKDSVTWRATHSLFVTTNYRPVVNETDTGTWRRLALVTFPYRFVKAPSAAHERQGDPNLRRVAAKDPAVLAAMLRWIVDGARRWYDADMVMPDLPAVVVDDTRSWRSESDMILAYWDDRLEAAPGSYVTSGDLLADYLEWTTARGNQRISEKTFTPRFQDHSETQRAKVQKRRSRTSQAGLSRPAGAQGGLPAQATVWEGVRFRDDNDPFTA